ncbi:MAG: 3-methyl-2-oxobutanoate dehydrogenase subunit VorB [bacterium]|nr:3-methyl-2-oxobutanoate dehydrogenase subunit VorB [bacterium]
MGEKVLMKGNEVIGEAAIIAGCRYYFGYPITPQSELPQYLSLRLPEVGGTFLQAESEIAAINMIYGAVGCGVRAMTSSSSPGVSLKMEGISYMAGAELPCVIVNICRGGPGLGNIAPSQEDYFQATKGGGHGNYRLIVLAPASVQEAAELTILAFELADKYRNPVMILGDGCLGQMMEPVDFEKLKTMEVTGLSDKPWATTGCRGREPNLISSIHLDPEELEQHVIHLYTKYQQVKDNETRYEMRMTEDADVVVVAYGIMARIVKTAVEKARKRGIKVGLFRPISLFPFPSAALAELARTTPAFLVAEMNMGQMVEDVRLAVNGRRPVEFFGRSGGVVPTPFEVLTEIQKINAQV